MIEALLAVCAGSILWIAVQLHQVRRICRAEAGANREFNDWMVTKIQAVVDCHVTAGALNERRAAIEESYLRAKTSALAKYGQMDGDSLTVEGGE